MNTPSINSSAGRIHMKCPMFRGDHSEHVSFYIETEEDGRESLLTKIADGKIVYQCHACGSVAQLAGDKEGRK